MQQDLNRSQSHQQHFCPCSRNRHHKLTLYCAHADIKSGSPTTKFSKAVQVTSQAIIMQKDTQIPILTNVKAQVNRVFVAKSSNKDKISLVSDNFFYPKKKTSKK
ncbi:hypothetical protein CTA1_5137 [Colletotrichum tanaceti]|uniref:Uncharacterized protein n=1 Tax=Colletotrichum tanaceti TaxID=1306861 RepID=A0A4U6XHN6_9PEZI|nr:hypothetical protein CTA1_5137 [Colletotrichum tanaceti]